MLGFLHVTLDPGVALEICIDILLSLVAANIQLLTKTERRHSIDETKIDRLGGTALLGIDLLKPGAEYFGGGGAVHIQAFGKGIEQIFVGRQMRHDTQLDLRVIERQDFATIIGHESFADTAAFGGSNRNILQVGASR